LDHIKPEEIEESGRAKAISLKSGRETEYEKVVNRASNRGLYEKGAEGRGSGISQGNSIPGFSGRQECPEKGGPVSLSWNAWPHRRETEEIKYMW